MTGAASSLPWADDEAARTRIAADLDTNLLVEAGAGSGKTRSLVDRLVAHVAAGHGVDQLAAVTFTRKAATELRERFQLALEERLRDGTAPELAARFDAALEQLDRGFIGTIHAFCARLLREYPLEAGHDPGAEEIRDEEWTAEIDGFWRRWLAAERRVGATDVAELERLGLDPADLAGAFGWVADNPDVDLIRLATPVPAPDPVPLRERLKELLARAFALMPAEEPEGGWDKLQTLAKRLWFLSRTTDWADPVQCLDALARVTVTTCKVIQKRWSADKDGKRAAKELGEAWMAFAGQQVEPALREWRAHRYPAVVAVLQRAATEFERERHRTGRLSFGDLLLGAARLLRDHPRVRRALGERYRYLLVDEFQDTDPVQAEVCLLLASDPEQGGDWRAVVPRPGALFVVGDPKQSIYRFRRADIAVYEQVKQRFTSFGEVLHLRRNFRSVDPIAEVVNACFAGLFPAQGSPEQAPFGPMLTDKPPAGDAGVSWYAVSPPEHNAAAITRQDANQVAAWIAAEVGAGRAPADFLVLTSTKKEVAPFAEALAAHNIPVRVTGAPLPQERELRELKLVLELLEDPAHPVRVAAVLEGLFFGLSPADLFDGARAGLRFDASAPPSERGAATRAGQALATLHGWWLTSRHQPADVVLERVLEATGLLPYAASQRLGDGRAGALLHLVESVRAASRGAGTDLASALAVIEAQLDFDAGADAPLLVGRDDAVRVMNLHQAKGLEAHTVILASPRERWTPPVTACTMRTTGGATTGALLVQGKKTGELAHPANWHEELAEEEQRMLEAERARLLYVAATRARERLVVARLVPEDDKSESAWSALGPDLDRLAPRRELPPVPLPGRRQLAVTAADIAASAAAAEARRRAAARPTWQLGEPVSRAVKDEKSTRAERADAEAFDLPPARSRGHGRAWGDALHRVLEAMGRGRAGDALLRFARAVVRDLAARGTPVRLDGREVDLDRVAAALVARATEVAAGQAWQRLHGARERRFELAVMTVEEVGGVPTVVEGVIDAVAIDDAGWRVIDWKTDVAAGEAGAQGDQLDLLAGREHYRDQVARYVAMVRRLTGGDATGDVVGIG